MMTSSNGNIFRVTGHLCREFTDPRWIPRTKASDAELWCFFDMRLNKRLSKQPWDCWFETLSRPLWRHCIVLLVQHSPYEHLMNDAYTVVCPVVSLCYIGNIIDNRLVSQMRATTVRGVICFWTKKTQYLLIHAQFTRIVIFWHIGNVPPTIS